MSLIKYISRCRVCGNQNLAPVLDLGSQTIQGAFETPSNQSPRRYFHSSLVRCDPTKEEGACGLVQMNLTIDPDILYSNYFYSSSVSKTMRNHLAEIAKEATKFKGNENCTVLDIAGNSGELLKNYPKSFNKFNIDPSDIALESKKHGVKLIQKCFPCPEVEGKIFDIITTIAMFYDADNPVIFCSAVESILAKSGVWICEFAYLPRMLSDLTYDANVLEHVACYSFDSFNYILEMVGLKAIKIVENNINGGSLQVWVSHKESSLKPDESILIRKRQELEMGLDLETPYSVFAKSVKSHVESLRKLIIELVENGKKVHILGSSTKGTCLLNLLELPFGTIKYAAERDERKFGAKIPHLGIEIISEVQSRNMSPDYYLVLPYHFKEEILEREAGMLGKTKFIFPLPKKISIV